MKILVVADDIADAENLEAMLLSDGHEVTSCRDEFGGPCRGLDHIEACPLERRVDLAVIARSANTRRGLGEMGALCAERRRVGVVEIDPSQPADESIAAMHARAERGVCHAHERAIIHELESAGAGDGAFVGVSRTGGVVRVTVLLDRVRWAATDDAALARLSDRVGAAARRFDRFAPTIDVVVRRTSSDLDDPHHTH